MASAPSNAALVSDPVGKPSVSGAPQQNGGSHTSKPVEGSTLTESTDTNSSEICAAPANDASSVPVSETRQEQANAGEKRELDTQSNTRIGVEESTGPYYKKQKTDKDAVATNNASANAQTQKAEPSHAAPQKKNGGRPRKTKDMVKKDITTDGIGSRTRSRTKVVS
ncbi:hypothetical protein BDW66DRAFT_22228 [Aspergillus desertorum]